MAVSKLFCRNQADYGLSGCACFVFKRVADNKGEETRFIVKPKPAADIVCLVFVRV